MYQRFTVTVLGAMLLSVIVIFILNTFTLVTSHTEPYIRFLLITIFLLTFGLMLYKEFVKESTFKTEKLKGIVVLMLPVLLVSTLFHMQVGTYVSGVFVGLSLLYFIVNKKLYHPVAPHYFLLAYALFLVIGTVSTTKGLHIPNITLSFFLLPLAFLLIDISQNDLLKAAKVFFRMVFIYLVCSIVYWWFNYQFLDADFISWISKKQYYQADMLLWAEQVKLVHGGNHFSAYFFVNSWTYYSHPSFVSMVLFFALLVGFYLQYKKPACCTVSKTELLAFNLLVFLVIALMQSRIGIVGFLFTVALTGLYYSKLKLHLFKITMVVYIGVGVLTMFTMDDKIDSFLNDNIRKTDYTLAFNYIKEHPWWGTGSFEQHLALEMQEELMIDKLPAAGNIKSYTHNQFLGTMVQFGIPGLIMLVTLIVAITLYAIRTQSYLLQMFIATMVLFMMIEEPLYRQVGVTRFTVFLLFFIAISESKTIRKYFDFNKSRKKSISETTK